MRWLGAAVGVVLAARAASAEPAVVDLLRQAPTVVAVSSTVANAAYLPEHLVDGDLATAWNSRTGEEHAWIAVRVPAGAHVSALKLTAGFTRKDRSGDLFTGNPRIQKVKITRPDGHVIGTFALAPDVRDLQTIAVDIPGGDFVIQVADLIPGTHPTWRETCVSELQVWGTLPPLAAAVPSRPVVRIGSLDALPAPTPAACSKLVFPGAHDPIARWEALGVGGDLALCRIDHAAAGSPDVVTELLAARRGAKGWARVGAPVTLTAHPPEGVPGGAQSAELELSLLPLTTSETAVRAELTTQANGPMYAATVTHTTLVRVTPQGAAAVLDLEVQDTSSEFSREADACTLADIPLGAALPPLVFECTHTVAADHPMAETPEDRGATSAATPSTRTFVWKGKAYVEKGTAP